MPRPPRSTMSNLTRALAFVTLGLASAADAQIDGGWKPNALEVAQLPKYCQGSFRPDLAGQPGYSLPQGCGVWINHFCPAIVALNRAGNLTAPMKDRVYSLQSAGGHLAYTRSHLLPTCPLTGELSLLERQAEFLRIMVK